MVRCYNDIGLYSSDGTCVLICRFIYLKLCLICLFFNPLKEVEYVDTTNTGDFRS